MCVVCSLYNFLVDTKLTDLDTLDPCIRRSVSFRDSDTIQIERCHISWPIRGEEEVVQ